MIPSLYPCPVGRRSLAILPSTPKESTHHSNIDLVPSLAFKFLNSSLNNVCVLRGYYRVVNNTLVRGLIVAFDREGFDEGWVKCIAVDVDMLLELLKKGLNHIDRENIVLRREDLGKDS